MLLVYSVNSDIGTYSNKICFGTTRKEDPKKWFCNEYPEFKCDSLRKVLEFGNVTYYRVLLDQSKRTRSLSKDTEDTIVQKHKHSNDFISFQQEIAYQRVLKTNDAEWPNLWHLNNNISPSLKIMEAWDKGYNGSGITVAIVDDGLQKDHPDLDANVNTLIGRDVYDDDSNPDPGIPVDENTHGTQVGGLIAAEIDNNNCIVGVAHQSALVGIRLLGTSSVTDSQEAEALGWQLNDIDIYTNSWGPIDGYGFSGPGSLAKIALQNGVSNGRGGKGVIYTWAAGNGDTSDNCNGDGYVNSIFTIAITSVQQGENAWYAEVCAAAFAATYGGSKLDQHLTTTNAPSGCTSDGVEGTSFSAPIASGIIALALHANPNLTWRDVQHLIVLTTSRSGFSDTYSSWQTNGAGKEFSQVLGFGFMDAEAMVTQAVGWTTSVPSQSSCTTSSFTGSGTTSDSFKLDNRTIELSDCSSISYLEHVTIDIDFSYDQKRGVTVLYLLSPSGTESHLLHSRYNDVVQFSTAGSLSWTFMSVHFWGENPIGTWTLKFKSHLGLSTVTINSWTLTFYGTTTNPLLDSFICASSPCQNNGTCSSNQYSYSCQCFGEFTGTDCASTIINSSDVNTESSTKDQIDNKVYLVLIPVCISIFTVVIIVFFKYKAKRVVPYHK